MDSMVKKITADLLHGRKDLDQQVNTSRIVDTSQSLVNHSIFGRTYVQQSYGVCDTSRSFVNLSMVGRTYII